MGEIGHDRASGIDSDGRRSALGKACVVPVLVILSPFEVNFIRLVQFGTGDVVVVGTVPSADKIHQFTVNRS